MSVVHSPLPDHMVHPRGAALVAAPKPRIAHMQAVRGPVAGSGLGLAIAREFAEAHGGRIRVVPEDGGGHFRFTLPRKSPRLSAVPA